jgi:anionic cell wall polymer biosynthesis LytR-Cps2A-Psr (LCP) family protein
VDGRLAAGQAGTAGSSSSSTLRDEPIQDDDAHINLPAGCQVLDGPNALGFARAREFDPTSDLGLCGAAARGDRVHRVDSAVAGPLLNPLKLSAPPCPG